MGGRLCALHASSRLFVLPSAQCSMFSSVFWPHMSNCELCDRIPTEACRSLSPPTSLPPCLPMVPCPTQTGMVYAVEFSHRSGRDLINMAKNRTNIIPIIEDARHPLK